MGSLLAAAAGVSLSFAAALAGAQSATPLAEVPLAGYGDAHVWPDCTPRVASGAAWSVECRLSGNFVGDGFTLPLDHAFRLGSTGCALVLPGGRYDADIACRGPGQQFGGWIEVLSILGTPCRAAGAVWSRVTASTEGELDPPVMHVVLVEIELIIEPGQAACEAGTWHEPGTYLICAEQPDPAPGWTSVNERVCAKGTELQTFEAVHRKPERTDENNPWHRRLFAQVRS